MCEMDAVMWSDSWHRSTSIWVKYRLCFNTFFFYLLCSRLIVVRTQRLISWLMDRRRKAFHSLHVIFVQYSAVSYHHYYCHFVPFTRPNAFVCKKAFSIALIRVCSCVISDKTQHSLSIILQPYSWLEVVVFPSTIFIVVAFYLKVECNAWHKLLSSSTTFDIFSFRSPLHFHSSSGCRFLHFAYSLLVCFRVNDDVEQIWEFCATLSFD